MTYNPEKLHEAKKTIQSLADGKDPATGDPISEDSVLNNHTVVRNLYFVLSVMEDMSKSNKKGQKKKKGKTPFHITEEQKKQVVFPDREIGVNEFVNCLNAVIDDTKIKKLSSPALNKKLREMEILGSEITAKDKVRTILNETSADYGFKGEYRNYYGNEYFQIIYTEKAMEYVLENINTIMESNH